MKIADDQSGNNIQMKEIFHAAFYKDILGNGSDVPIERAICELASLIRNNKVLGRYTLD
jgi:prephenate dehydratase